MKHYCLILVLLLSGCSTLFHSNESTLKIITNESCIVESKSCSALSTGKTYLTYSREWNLLDINIKSDSVEKTITLKPYPTKMFLYGNIPFVGFGHLIDFLASRNKIARYPKHIYVDMRNNENVYYKYDIPGYNKGRLNFSITLPLLMQHYKNIREENKQGVSAFGIGLDLEYYFSDNYAAFFRTERFGKSTQILDNYKSTNNNNNNIYNYADWIKIKSFVWGIKRDFNYFQLSSGFAISKDKYKIIESADEFNPMNSETAFFILLFLMPEMTITSILSGTVDFDFPIVRKNYYNYGIHLGIERQIGNYLFANFNYTPYFITQNKKITRFEYNHLFEFSLFWKFNLRGKRFLTKEKKY